MAVEAARACGYRKVGGLYLVGHGAAVECDRLPLPLDECPACGRVAEQNRSHEWLGPEYFANHARPLPVADYVTPEGVRFLKARGLVAMLHRTAPCRDQANASELRRAYGDHPGRHDPICERGTYRRLLLWVGRAFYSPESFTKEATEMGISRRLTQIPKGLVLGETWVLLAHPEACYEPLSWAFRWLFGDGEVARAPGVFHAFRPERLELVLKQSDATPERIAKEAARGVTVVAVPDDDKDHRGTVWKKEADEAAPPLALEDLPMPDAATPGPRDEPGPIGPLDRYDPLGGDA